MFSDAAEVYQEPWPTMGEGEREGEVPFIKVVVRSHLVVIGVTRCLHK